jgi:hypothetical protein
MKETLSVLAVSRDNDVNQSAETEPLTFVRVTIEEEGRSIESQVRMRDVADRGIVLGD